MEFLIVIWIFKKLKKGVDKINSLWYNKIIKREENKKMTTIIIAKDITATLTNRKARQYQVAMEATENTRNAMRDEDLDWGDLDYLWSEEYEAWEKFFS